MAMEPDELQLTDEHQATILRCVIVRQIDKSPQFLQGDIVNTIDAHLCASR